MRMALRRFGRLSVPLFALPLCAALLQSQGRAGRNAAANESATASSDPIVENFRFRSIGPASMGGRIDDIAVSESNPNVIYVGYAVGGVFRSTNNGDDVRAGVRRSTARRRSATIAIDPTNPDIVYVGTGEPNNRQTSTFGDGIYKTTDGGKTFTNIGLRETQTIARIVIDPRNPEVVYVAVARPPVRPEPGPRRLQDDRRRQDVEQDQVHRREHRLHRHRDGSVEPERAVRGELPAPPQRLLLQRRRPGQRALEDGRRRQELDEDSGRADFPPGTYGRIALDVSRSNPNVVYAQIEAGETERRRGTPRCGRRVGRGGGAARRPRRRRRRRRRGGYDWCNNGAPAPGSAGRDGTGQGRRRSTPTKGGMFRSENKGRSWTSVSNCNARPMYFSQLRVDPTNDKTHLRRGPAGGEVARRRQDVRDARRRRRLRRAGRTWTSTRSGSIRRTRSHHARQRRRFDVTLGPGQDVGLREHDGDGSRVLGHRRHAPSVQRLLRAAGQRQLGRAERDAQRRAGSMNHEWFRHRRRRRVPDRGGPDRPAHRLYASRRTAARAR